MKEEWRPVVGYEGIYEVSNLGVIKSLDRKDSLGRYREGRIISQINIGGKGYLGFQPSKNGIKKNLKIHHAVAYAFIGNRPMGKVIDHIDNDKSNNNLSNLRYISNRINCSKDKIGVSRYTGVTWDKKLKKWCSKIRLEGRQRHLGYFEKEIDAYKAYEKELLRLET